MDMGNKTEGFEMYILKQHKDGFAIEHYQTGRQLATFADLLDAIQEVRACNREARRLRAG